MEQHKHTDVNICFDGDKEEGRRGAAEFGFLFG